MLIINHEGQTQNTFNPLRQKGATPIITITSLTIQYLVIHTFPSYYNNKKIAIHLHCNHITKQKSNKQKQLLTPIPITNLINTYVNNQIPHTHAPSTKKHEYLPTKIPPLSNHNLKINHLDKQRITQITSTMDNQHITSPSNSQGPTWKSLAKKAFKLAKKEEALEPHIVETPFITQDTKHHFGPLSHLDRCNLMDQLDTLKSISKNNTKAKF